MKAVEKWIASYIAAWNSNDRADIEALFTEDASYSTAPYAQPQRGRARIVKWWLANQDEPGTTTFTWEPLAITNEVAVIQGTATYPDRAYSNIWVIRLDKSGRCREFTEWYMEHPRKRARS